MRTIEARRLLNRHCQPNEEWRCGPVMIRLTGKDKNPRFDRRIQIFLDQSPERVDIRKISRLLQLLDRLGCKKKSCAF